MERDVSSPTASIYDEFALTLRAPQAVVGRGRTRDAPRDAVATITYNADGYDFRISDVSIFLNFDFDCQLQQGGSGVQPAPTAVPAEAPVEPAGGD
jgi:hypothetical protein